MMSDFVHIELLPLGKVLRVKRGTPLQDVLFAHGVEFPCGGRGRCKGCKIKVLAGALPVTEEEQQRLTGAELAEGWRLACRGQAEGDLKIELAQWEAAILTDDSVFAFTPREGWGIAIDLGTTTIVAQLIDLQTGHVLAVRAALNAQAKCGADIMSRVDLAVAGQGQRTLQNLVRKQIGRLTKELLTAAGGTAREVESVVLVGNTVMHHLFCGISLEPLSHYPFEPVSPGLQVFEAAELGWSLPGNPAVRFLPCLGSFVGSDILAGLLATQLHESERLAALIDLGTNGEIVVGNRERLLCASTAAGPAFEGARISMGMRAATGAISEVHVRDGGLQCHVLGDVAPRGICGAGWWTRCRPDWSWAGFHPRAGWPMGSRSRWRGRCHLINGTSGNFNSPRRDCRGAAHSAGTVGRATDDVRKSFWRAPSATTSITPAHGASGFWFPGGYGSPGGQHGAARRQARALQLAGTGRRLRPFSAR